MSETPTPPQSRIKDLILKGKEQGYLTYAEVNDHLPEGISDPDQVEDIIQMINDMGITVFEETPDAETLLLNDNDSADDVAAAEAAAALAAVETEVGRTTDPVRMYMREMGTVELLTREGEIVIAKRIEEGIREMMASLAHLPNTVVRVINEYDLVAKEERKLADIMTGYLDPQDTSTPPPPPVINTGEKKDDDEEEDTGPDPEEAKRRFGVLRKQLNKAEKLLENGVRSDVKVQKELIELGELFKFFKLTPRQLEPLIVGARGNHEAIRRHEKDIMKYCVTYGRMPRKEFIASFVGSESDPKWLNNVTKRKQDYAPRIEASREEVARSQRKIGAIEKKLGMNVAEIKDIHRKMSLGETRMRRAKKDMVEANLR
ncbi:MAG: RNA polymerase sigma factor region1.1 domain-containing protein, partial [Sinobacterium sp.]